MPPNNSEMITAGDLLEKLAQVRIPEDRPDLALDIVNIRTEVAEASREHRSHSARNDRGELLPGIGEVFKEVRLENFGGHAWLGRILQLESQSDGTSLITSETEAQSA